MSANPQFGWERRIEWVRDDADEMDYVRERVVMVGRPAGTLPRRVRRPGYYTLVAYSVLDRQASKAVGGRSHLWARRMWYLKDGDRPLDPDGAFKNQCPAEAVDPLSVSPGVPSDPPREERLRGSL